MKLVSRRKITTWVGISKTVKVEWRVDFTSDSMDGVQKDAYLFDFGNWACDVFFSLILYLSGRKMWLWSGDLKLKGKLTIRETFPS